MTGDDMKAPAREAPAEEELPPHWKRIQGAIWLLGLAILAWQNWWWPGILVLVAVSGLVQGLIQWQISRQRESKAMAQAQAKAAEARAGALPENCPTCGGPIHSGNVEWTSETTAACPYCGGQIKASVPN